jgi:hypothetical protein
MFAAYITKYFFQSKTPNCCSKQRKRQHFIAFVAVLIIFFKLHYTSSNSQYITDIISITLINSQLIHNSSLYIIRQTRHSPLLSQPRPWPKTNDIFLKPNRRDDSVCHNISRVARIRITDIFHSISRTWKPIGACLKLFKIIKKIDIQGFEPATLGTGVRRSTDWANGTTRKLILHLSYNSLENRTF